MNPSSSTSTEPALTVVTTASGIAGGLVKVTQLKLQLLSVTWDGSMSVIVYAVLSAAAGYITKSAFDYLVSKTRKHKSK